MKAKKDCFYCSECKKIIKQSEDVLVVEESYARPFCSEKCIMDYHAPYLRFFESQEHELRTKLGIQEDRLIKTYISNQDLVKNTLSDPDEIWVDDNDIGEEFFTYVKTQRIDNQTLHVIVIAFVYEEEASMVLFHTLTQHQQLLDCYRIEVEIDDYEEKEEEELGIEIDPKLAEHLERKKAEYLGHLIETRSDDDIGIEKFPLYEDYLRQTLENPDEVFERLDEEDDILLTYIKAYHKEGKTFFYIVVCVKIDEDEENQHDLIVPIISFPSIDGDLYNKYKMGDRITGGLKN